jgi:hypothetical protein
MTYPMTSKPYHLYIYIFTGPNARNDYMPRVRRMGKYWLLGMAFRIPKEFEESQKN